MPNFRFEDISVEAAIVKAETELGIKREMLDIEVLEEKQKGILGIKWGKVCAISASPKNRKEDASQKTVQTHKSTKTDNEVIEEALATLDKLMEMSGFKGDINAFNAPEEIILDVKLEAELESLFIGRRGKNIDAYQYITNKMVENTMQERVKRIVIDCAEYRIRRRESLQNMAKKAAQELKNGGRLYTFPPMQAGDRRIIHMTMKEEGFNTESRGRGEEKKVVALTSQ